MSKRTCFIICQYARRATEAGLAIVLVGASAGVVPGGPRRRWPVRLLVAAEQAYAEAGTAVPGS